MDNRLHPSLPHEKQPKITKNYKDIILTIFTAEIYNALILNHIKVEMEKILRKNQDSFQRNRSITL